MKPFRVCVIGCGWIARSSHGPSYLRYAAQHPDVQFAACCDTNPQHAEQFRARFGFERAYTDHRAMIALEKPDAVCLLVPPPVTCGLACEILRLGIPLLLEKPPGLTVEEFEAIRSAAEESGTPHLVAFNRRFTPLVQTFKEYFAARFRPEDVQYLRYELTRIGRTDPDFSTTAVHGIDTAAFLSGARYASVKLQYQPFPHLGPAVANTYLSATLASGAAAQINFLPVTGVVTERAVIAMGNHTFFLDLPVPGSLDAPGRLLHLEKGRAVLDISGPEAAGGDEEWLLNGFYAENAAFFDAVRAGQQLPDGLAGAYQSVAISQAMRERKTDWDVGKTR